MRSKSILSFLVACVPLSTTAQDVPMGCYLRDYSHDHLAQHREQVIKRISILFEPQEGFTSADVKILFANQGHAARDGYGGMRASELAGNYDMDARFIVECDGGSFDVVSSSSKQIVIETKWFRLSDNGCSGDRVRSTLLEEGSLATRYRLDQVDDIVCDW